MTRLFVAAWPSPSASDAVAALGVETADGVRPVPPENWHVTLRFVGDADVGEVTAALARSTLPPATVHLGPEVSQLDQRQVVVPAAGVDALAAAVDRAVGHLGKPRRHRFVGHLTVARVRPGAACAAIGRRIEASFDVTSVALVASDLQPTGARYHTLVEFPTSD